MGHAKDDAKINGLWFLFGLFAFVLSGSVAMLLRSPDLYGEDAPVYPVVMFGGALMFFSFWMSARRAAVERKNVND